MRVSARDIVATDLVVKRCRNNLPTAAENWGQEPALPADGAVSASTTEHKTCYAHQLIAPVHEGIGRTRVSRRARLALTVGAAALLVGAAPKFLLADPTPPVAPRLGAAIQYNTIRVGDLDRSYLSYVPARRGVTPALLVVLHGARGTGRRMRALTAYEFDTLADRNNFVVVYPDGFERSWNDCREAVATAKRPQVDDVGVIPALIERFRTQFGIATSRVFAIGFSAGGQMAYRLAIDAQDARGIIAG